jgi:hypothetical protein
MTITHGDAKTYANRLLLVILKQEHWLCRADQGVLVPVPQTGEGGGARGS